MSLLRFSLSPWGLPEGQRGRAQRRKRPSTCEHLQLSEESRGCTAVRAKWMTRKESSVENSLALNTARISRARHCDRVGARHFPESRRQGEEASGQTSWMGCWLEIGWSKASPSPGALDRAGSDQTGQGQARVRQKPALMRTCTDGPNSPVVRQRIPARTSPAQP